MRSPDDGESKQLTATDHYPVFSTNKIRVGSPTLDSDFNQIYKNYFKERGLDENQIRDVISIMISVQTSDQDKALEKTLKLVRRYCIESKFAPEISNAIGLQVHKAYQLMRGQTFSRNIAGALVQKDEKKRLRSAKRLIVGFCDLMGITSYEMGSMLVGSEKE
jgi:hypothetical protein